MRSTVFAVTRNVGGRLLVMACGLAVLAVPSAAQERDSIPGVSLGLLYEATFAPAVAVKPFSEGVGLSGVALQVEAIIGRDLRNSDRFEVLDSIPAVVMGQGIDYTLWDRLGAVWLVSGRVEAAEQGSVLDLQLHDVLFGEVREEERFPLPDQLADDFRMAVHRVSDRIVEWTTGEPGMAASRIAFAMPAGDGQKEIYVIDSDGENLRRVTDAADIALSPVWSPDASKIAYQTWIDGRQRIVERQMATGDERLLDAGSGDGNYLTPTYHPDGQTMAFSVSGGTRSGLFTYDIRRNCCLAYLSGGPGWDDVSPTYSPDGSWMAFNTNRFGTETPQIMTMPGAGGSAETLSPYEYGSGGYYTSPDWSPTGDYVAFHGRIRRGRYQILVADLRDRGRRLRQLTWEGNNEDPTWAPDGRHLAFVGEREWGFGLFVVDVATGRIRALVSGRRVSVPDWSAALVSER